MEFEALRAQFATTVGVDQSGRMTLAEERRQSERVSDLASEPDRLQYEYDEFGRVRVLVHRPVDVDEGHVIEYLHGGGYRKRSIESHRKVVGHIAKAAGAIAISVDYRLTPEHRHPAQAEDSLARYRARRHLFGGPVGDRRRFGRWQIGPRYCLVPEGKR
jgi:acetyl esterase/lipase